MSTKTSQRGFTLIELLVVIAIIGILASVVLASLNSARNKGSDAAIKSNLANMRAQAELFYDNNSNTYGTAFTEGACAATVGTLFADTTMNNAWAAAQTASGGTARCSSTTAAWAVSVPLKSTPANAWCVDSTGASKEVTAGDAGIASSACV